MIDLDETLIHYIPHKLAELEKLLQKKMLVNELQRLLSYRVRPFAREFLR